MGIADAAKTAFENSVSFGRFEKDSLSWEKFSSFSPNKYLEEVEKCATPGSVASKKAYFEAHYKKIAAQKATELQADSNSTSDDSARSDEDKIIDLVSKSAESERYTSCCDAVTFEEKIEDKLMDETSEMKHRDVSLDMICKKLAGEAVVEANDSMRDVSSSNGELEGSSSKFDTVEDMKKRIEIIPVESTLLDETEANTLAKQISNEGKYRPPKDVKTKTRTNKFVLPSEAKKEVPKRLAEEVNRKKRNAAKLSSTKISQKTGLMSMPQEVVRQKKKALVIGTMKPQLSTSKKLYSTQLMSPRSSAMKLPASSSARKNVSAAKQDDKVAVKSRHPSVCLDAKGSDEKHVTTARNSLIMERMKDKDIIKRAFKTFQQSFDQPTSPTTQPSSRRSTVKSPSTAARSMEKRTLHTVSSPLQLGSDKKYSGFGRKSEEKTEVQVVRQSFNYKATSSENKGTKNLLGMKMRKSDRGGGGVPSG